MTLKLVRQGFENTLSLDPNEIERVTVIRHRVVKASPDMLQTFRQRICRKIEEYVKEGDYELDLRNPKEADFTYLAFLTTELLNDLETSIAFENLTNP
jgi:septum formation topological specificity factor MinE